eukprot:jgi/Antlo1/38/768
MHVLEDVGLLNTASVSSVTSFKTASGTNRKGIGVCMRTSKNVFIPPSL